MIKVTYKTILLTGIPRSGTTLCCHLLNQQPNVLALHEPMSPADFNAEDGRSAACKKVEDFAGSVRKQVHKQGTARSSHRDGKIPDNPIEEHAQKPGLRQPVITQGDIDVSARQLSPGFSLVIKHNALFTALLPELQDVFPVYAIIRNPLAVLCSWNSVDLPVNRGRLPAGENFSPQLKKDLDACDNRLNRQMIILSWIFKILKQHVPKENILRYEDIVVNPNSLFRMVGSEASEDRAFTNKNKNTSYVDLKVSPIYQRLLAMDGASWNFYSRDDIDRLYHEITHKQS